MAFAFEYDDHAFHDHPAQKPSSCWQAVIRIRTEYGHIHGMAWLKVEMKMMWDDNCILYFYCVLRLFFAPFLPSQIERNAKNITLFQFIVVIVTISLHHSTWLGCFAFYSVGNKIRID